MRIAFLAFLLGLILLVCAPGVHAQQAPPCVAGLYGQGGHTPPKLVYGRHAIYYAYSCNSGPTTSTAYVKYLEKYSLSAVTAFAAAMAQAIQDSINAPDGTNLQAIWSPLFTRPDCTFAERSENSDRGRLCEETAQVLMAYLAANAPPAPPPEAWKVKANGAYPDRPVQRISATNGLTTISGVRVVVGATCYPAVRQFTNTAGNTYAAIDATMPDRVAVCTRSTTP